MAFINLIKGHKVKCIKEVIMNPMSKGEYISHQIGKIYTIMAIRDLYYKDKTIKTVSLNNDYRDDCSMIEMDEINFTKHFREVQDINNNITKEEIMNLVINKGLTIFDVIDAVIDINGIIGVGIISLRDDVAKYIMTKM